MAHDFFHLKTAGAFSRLARRVSTSTGHPTAFFMACLVILVWGVTGPVFGFSDTWQLVINTGTTVVTFLMVFLIQNTQNRDSEAMHVKLDELIRAVDGAHNVLLDLEEVTQEDLDKIRASYVKLARHAREELRQGRVDTGRTALDSD